MPGVDQVGAPPIMGGPCLWAADVTLTESIDALLPKPKLESRISKCFEKLEGPKMSTVDMDSPDSNLNVLELLA